MDNECKNIYEIHCKEEFSELKQDVRQIKEALLGNGKTGLVIKVDRNTRWIQLMNWIYGAVFTGVFLVWVVSVIINRK